MIDTILNLLFGIHVAGWKAAFQFWFWFGVAMFFVIPWMRRNIK